MVARGKECKLNEIGQRGGSDRIQIKLNIWKEKQKEHQSRVLSSIRLAGTYGLYKVKKYFLM